MYALLKQTAGAGLNLEDVAEPVVRDRDVLLKVRAASICGTDVHIFDWHESIREWMNPPVIVGHEFTGEVVAVGKDVRRVKSGDLVSVESRIACGECYQCNTGRKHLCTNLKIIGIHSDGGFAQYASIPQESCWKLDREIPVEVACMMDALGLAVHAALEEDVCGNTVVVFGSGATGILAGSVAKAGGAEKVITLGRTPYRLSLAQRMGADYTINIRTCDPREEIMELTRGKGVDLVLEMSGSEAAINLGLAVLKKGGKFTAFGIPRQRVMIDWTNELVMKGIRLHAIIGRKIFHTWYKMMALLDMGRIDPRPVVTHRMKLTDYPRAFEMLKSKEKNCGKIMFEID